MKGQAAVMEKIIMLFFIVIVIVGLIVFLSWWNVSQVRIEGQKDVNERALGIAKAMMTDSLFVKDVAMFDDSKLKAANKTACKAFEKIFGAEWFAEVTELDGNRWSICVKDRKSTSYDIPVNIFNQESEKVSVGNLKVGVYR
ncbi:MAG: hypothetical protein ABIH52_03335 [Candidatus Aenigmatarchaeota archaeon]|nr:hypothetical protein [Nanoarchaeota archaeon]